MNVYEKILVLTPLRVQRGGAGDWIQSLKTVQAMRELGYCVDHDIFDDLSPAGAEDLGRRYSVTQLCQYTVIHFLPAVQSARIATFVAPVLALAARPRPLVVGSTVFWRSLSDIKVNVRNAKGYDVRLRLCFRFLMGYWGRARDFRNYDLLLPNSYAETRVVRGFCRCSARCEIVQVPNGIGDIPEWARELPSFPGCSSGEYLIYPGVFSPRKNQLGFIRATQSMRIPTVFMGGAMLGAEDYFEQCRKEAPESMLFTGRIVHESREFFQLIGHARVACLASACETPGIALLEAAALGARPILTDEGGGFEYHGFSGQYFRSSSSSEIKAGVRSGWLRGRLNADEQKIYKRYNWRNVAEATFAAYDMARGSIANKL